MKPVRTFFLLAALAPLCSGATPLSYKYKIYCVEGMVRVEKLTIEELREEFPEPICELARTAFVSLPTARKAAKRFGGIGAPCKCSSARGN